MIEQEMLEIVRKLETLDERAQMTLLSRVDEQRNELAGVLLKHLGTSSNPSVQAAAIYLIGRHRLSQGVAELTSRIDFNVNRKPSRGSEPLWDQYPAMEALIAIGRPAVRPAIELLSTEANELRRDLALKVVQCVEDPEIAELLLARARAAETDPSRKTNLLKASESLARMQEGQQ